MSTGRQAKRKPIPRPTPTISQQICELEHTQRKLTNELKRVQATLHSLKCSEYPQYTQTDLTQLRLAKRSLYRKLQYKFTDEIFNEYEFVFGIVAKLTNDKRNTNK